MPKLRVYQLARELNRDNSEIIRELQHLGVPVTSHSNTVEDRLAEQLRKKLGVFSGADTAVAVEAPPQEEHIEVAAELGIDRIDAKPEPVVEELKIVEPARVEARPEAPAEPKIELKPAATPPPAAAPEPPAPPAATVAPPTPAPPARPAPPAPRYIEPR